MKFIESMSFILYAIVFHSMCISDSLFVKIIYACALLCPLMKWLKANTIFVITCNLLFLLILHMYGIYRREMFL